jgi:hypothetical protein
MSEKKVDIKTGKKVDQSEVKSLDPAKIGPSQVLLPKEGEVEGQYLRYRTVICPYCNGLVNLVEETAGYSRYRCCFCGYIFQF